MNVQHSGPAGVSAAAMAMGRAQSLRREPLTRKRVVRTALHIMDEEGLDAVTMRRVGRELGVEAMSLYNHVRDKDDLLEAICEEVLAEFRVQQFGDWSEGARLAAHEYRRLLLAHPQVVTLMSARKGPFTNPDSLRAYELAFEIFRQAGLSAQDSVLAFNAFGGFILGYVVMELGMMVGGNDEVHAQAHLQMSHLLAGADLPRLREAMPYLADCDVNEQFEFGLDLLIAGIEARLSKRREPDAAASSSVGRGR
jgi:AcrR family transcriptional regulator